MVMLMEAIGNSDELAVASFAHLHAIYNSLS